MKAILMLTLLPAVAMARRPGAFNSDLEIIYLGIILFCGLLLYGGKVFKKSKTLDGPDETNK